MLTVQNEGSEPYQGIVALQGDTLADAIEAYFALSEQLATRIWLAADGGRAAGLLLQELPQHSRNNDDWERLCALASTITAAEMLRLPADQLLYRLFNEEQVRLFEPEPVRFECSCSRERIAAVLRMVGQSDLEDALRNDGQIEVDCEFCNGRYHFDLVDIGAIFSGEVAPPQTGRHH